MKLDAPEVTIFTNMPHTHESAAQGGPSTAPETVAATAKATPVDADQLPLVDSAAADVLKKLTWVNVKATLKTYFDTLYTNNTGTVTSVAAITLGTTGTDLSSTVATGTTTPVITLQVPSASAANRGALLAADWTTFNSKQAGGTYVTPTTLNNNSLAASVTTLTTSGTNTMSALGAGIATFSAAGVISSLVQPAFSASRSANQTITTGATTKVEFNTEQFDTNSNYDNATNYRFTPTVAGYYQINVALNGADAGVGSQDVLLRLYKNGAQYLAPMRRQTGAGAQVGITLSQLVYCNGTDYLEVYLQVVAGTNFVIYPGSNFNGSQARGA